MSVFVVDDTVLAGLQALRDFAENNVFSYEQMLILSSMDPRDVGPLGEEFTVHIPHGYVLKFTVENQGPQTGLCRHMSLQSPNVGRVPIPQAVQMVMEPLGFSGSFHTCSTWTEHPEDQGVVIHILEPMDEKIRQSIVN